MRTFQIVRVFYREGKRPRVIRRGLTFKQARRYVEHDPDASSITARDWQEKVARIGHWFDIFQPEAI